MPAEPQILDLRYLDMSYPYITAEVPTLDVNGNMMLFSKLYYELWIEKDGMEEPLVLTKDLYSYIPEDMTEIPYVYDDNFDISRGGSLVYLNQDVEEIDTWKKIGIQSIYYGGGECNKSDIAWKVNETADRISSPLGEKGDAIIYNLAGQRIGKIQKGINIMNGKKIVK